MRLARWDPLQELVPVSYCPNRTEDSFGPRAVDFLAKQDHMVETAKPELIEIDPA